MTAIWQFMRKFIQTFFLIDNSRRIKFGNGAIYFQISPTKVKLFAGLADVGVSAGVSVAHARDIFEGIRMAQNHRDIRRVEAGEIVCTADCRVVPRAPDRVSVKFAGDFGSTSMRLTRAEIAKTLDDFDTKLARAGGT
jgi:hypothetical protein